MTVINDAPANYGASSAPVATGFVERRSMINPPTHSKERRQFANSHTGLTEEASQLAQAIDKYKLMNRRRYITFEEMLNVIKSLGYSR